MTSSTRQGARLGLGLLACSMILAGGPAAAQQRWQQGAPPQSYGPVQQTPPPASDPASELRRNLATVGSSPNNVAALVDSGRAALAMGDAQAALTFFSRADEVSPRDPRIKAGMASAMTLLGQPRPALTLFAEAQGLGAPEVEIAADRGLAHDLLGDPRAAQRDYALAMRGRDSDETRRRLALSLAISGQREPALRLLEPQVRRNDRAGWRTQAFVLALTGDAAGAARVASGAGPVGTAEAMAPFLGRLPALSPAQRAMAVHLGIFPSDGRAQYAANIDTTPDPGALALAGGPARPPAPTAVAEQPPRRDERPGLRRGQAASSPTERAAVRGPSPPREERPPSFAERREGTYRIPGPNFPARTVRRVPAQEAPSPPPAVVEQSAALPPPVPATTRFAPPPVEEQPAPAPSRPVEEQAAPPPPVAQAPSPAPGIDASILAGVRPGDMIAAPGFSLTPQSAPAAAIPAVSERRNSALGDIAMVVNALPQEQGASRPSSFGQPQAPQRQTPPPPAESSRHWVQVAGNIDRASMADEVRRLRGRAPALLSGMQTWTSRTGQTGRLLVGPFGSARDAQAFVNQLRPRGIEAITWASQAGQAVERLSAPAAPVRAARAAPERRPDASRTRDRSDAQRGAATSRSARGRAEEAPASSRTARGRGADSRATAGLRTSRNGAENDARARGRAEPARAGTNRRNSRTESARAGTNPRNGRAAADTRSNRGTSTVERRANGNDARPSRSRSAQEQRQAARGRRSD
jgi:tetratricopeptide (TPR) repeat protein